MSSNKLLTVLAAAGLTAAGLGAASANEHKAADESFDSVSTPALEAFLQDQPTSAVAPEAFNVLASRLRAPDERARPDDLAQILIWPPGQQLQFPEQYPG